MTHNGRRASERGQSFAEFAIVLPVLLLLVFGVFDFGRGMSANVTVTNSAREGARYIVALATTSASSYQSCSTSGATISPSTTSGEGQAWRQLANDGLTLTQVQMIVRLYRSDHDPATSSADYTYTCPVNGGAATITGSYTPKSGDWVQFEVDYTYVPITPLVSNIFHNTINIAQQATMVIE